MDYVDKKQGSSDISEARRGESRYQKIAKFRLGHGIRENRTKSREDVEYVIMERKCGSMSGKSVLDGGKRRDGRR